MNDYKNMTIEELLDCYDNGDPGVSRDAQRELVSRGISAFTGKKVNK